ncbi:MAG TPA: hypothetical protein VGQ44_01430 [Gemmatimonadaceae bacterium]|jgi:hypothetical protein|nr:hypothetical protein [Gemmatimonadaceae bacterium]
MPITRTAWIDDDGSGTTGTVLNNAVKTELYNQIDAALSIPGAVQTTTATGTQADFVLTAGCGLLRCNNATLLTLTGLAAGGDGQRLLIVSVGAGQVDLANQNTGSAVANRLINGVTGTRSLTSGAGWALVEYDLVGTRWRVVGHEQGAWITPAYNAGDYTASGGTWTVDAGDVQVCVYKLTGKTLSFKMSLLTTSVSQICVALVRLLPGGFTAASRTDFGLVTRSDNGGARGFGSAIISASTNSISFVTSPDVSGTWSVSVNATLLECEMPAIEVQ